MGISASLFDRVSFNIEFYNRVTSDMLMDVPQPYSTGLVMDRMKFATIKANVGKYQNRGGRALGFSYSYGHDYGLNFF